MEQIIVTAVESIRKSNPTALTGQAAIAGGGDNPPRGYVTDRILFQGDVVTIPSMEDGNEQQDQWLFAPAVLDGTPVLHCVAQVLRGGQKLAMPLFIGNFVKEVTDTDNTIYRNVILDKSGQPIDLTSTMTSIGEQWATLAGRTFRIESVQAVKTMRRNRKTMVAYEGTANVYTYVEV